MGGHGEEHPVAEKPRPTLEELHARKERTRQRVLGDRETITVSMGPQHPSMHGVFQAVLELDGEIVVKTTPYIGNLHRGVEKMAEDLTYHQVIPLTDRLDYISSFAMNHAYCEAVEKLMGVEVPRRARYIRTIGDELCRLSNHLLWLGVHIMDFGATTFYEICFRDREYILDLWEMLCGARLTHSYARLGGVAKDLPDGWVEKCRTVIEFLPRRLAEYQRLIEKNRIFLKRAVGIGIFPADECIRVADHRSGPALGGGGPGSSQGRALRRLRRDRLRRDRGVRRRRLRAVPRADEGDVRVLQDRPAGSGPAARRRLHREGRGPRHPPQGARAARRRRHGPGLRAGVPRTAGAPGRGLQGHRGAQGRDGRLHRVRRRS